MAVGILKALCFVTSMRRRLYWSRGNVLNRNDSVAVLEFNLEGKKMFVKTFGLLVSVIDFTLSGTNTGENILYLDLSLYAYLLKGPVGDQQNNIVDCSFGFQSETFRKMDVTKACWKEISPRTYVLWLLYLVDISLLKLKKSFLIYKSSKVLTHGNAVWKRASIKARDLPLFKKRLDGYQSA